MDNWRVRFDQYLADLGCADLKTWVEKNPGKHFWFAFDRKKSTCFLCGPAATPTNKCTGGATPRQQREIDDGVFYPEPEE